jgi:hypothetical protein
MNRHTLRVSPMVMFLASCGDTKSSPAHGDTAANGGHAAAGVPAMSAGGGAISSGGIDGRAGNSTGEIPLEPYPRTYADPSLTKPLATGEVVLVGEPSSACTNEALATGERWCAFARGTKDGPFSLWVVNVTRAAQGDVAPCDEEGPDCHKLTDQLWTGEDLWGPSHPRVHRFDGDTLIFYAEAAEPVRAPYAGPIFAWRPGWSQARRLTNDAGVACVGHKRKPLVYCIQSLDVEARAPTDFGGPIWREFDLYAGSLEQPDAPLSLVEHITMAADQQWAFRARFDRKGDRLAYSSVKNPGEHESLRFVSLSNSGSEAPSAVLDDASQWVLSHDGTTVYALRKFESDSYEGELVVADFPSGQNLRPIASRVSHVDPAGEDDDPASDEDRGVGYDLSTDAGYAFEFLVGRATASAPQRIGDAVSGPRVTASGTHTMLFQETASGWPVARVFDNATGKGCTLNREYSAETYNGRFTADSQRVIWIEYGSGNSEVGYASALDCSNLVKFGDWVLGYSLHQDFVVFEGGDEADSTSYLQYARLPSAAGTSLVTPRVVFERPRYPTPTLALSQNSYVVFAGDFGTPPAPGLYLHGPLENSF